MRSLRAFLDRQSRFFERGGPLEKLKPFYEAVDTFLFTPGHVTRTASHVRDALDLKRMMTIVVVALLPCMVWAMYNTGCQANRALDPEQVSELAGWRHVVIRGLGIGYSPDNVGACLVHGALYFLPVYVVTLLAGGFWEVLFAVVRRHEVSEGFFVTSALLPLTLPPSIPLWQVALGISFGVVFGKEVFGGTGMNFMNPALVSRAFLFFAYPAQISGDKVWVAVDAAHAIDGFSGATALAQVQLEGWDAMARGLSWWDAFWGFELGSMGETSVPACLIGAGIILGTRIASWRTMAGVVLGTFAMATFFNVIGSETNPVFQVSFLWHIVLGGWAFGTVFMATDPVSSAFTDKGKWIYGVMIGLLVVLIRVVNPAYPEGMMLSILLMNVFAPLIDYFVVKGNVKRRMARYAA